ncbi:tyrosine-type recombinase/integrase [Salinibacter ruber]|uniref:tyrosine-type recombinase/integrase n=1 Tax=Salinibacter ruber TaxID=146919 RepID=UPI00216A465C|nr:tyrosine-type recombinase/integrase [Salinibacter ruber]MCS3642772.1 integrase [Salinibacter ruber]
MPDAPDQSPKLLDQVRQLFAALSPGPNRLIAHLLYGSGLRLSEALRLRVKELDVGTSRLHVRDGKAGRTGRRCCPSASTARSGAT